MAEFEVKTDQLKRCAETECRISNKMSSLSSEIRSISKNLNMNSAATVGLKAALHTLSVRTNEQAGKMQKLSGALESISANYDRTEKNVQFGTLIAGGILMPPFSIPVPVPAPNPFILGALGSLILTEPIISGAKVTGTIMGFESAGKAEGNVFGGSVKSKMSATWKPEDGDAGVEMSISGEGHLAEGTVEGNIGMLSGNAGITVGAIGATGTVGATLYKDGKFAPSVGLEASAEVAAAKGKAGAQFGTEEYNGHVKAEGSVATAKASLEGKAGVITYKTDAGITQTGVGIQGKAGAEACLAKGTISGGFTILGVDIDIGVSGKAGAVGAGVGGYVTTGGISGKLDVSAIIGVGLEITIDWSDFSLW